MGSVACVARDGRARRAGHWRRVPCPLRTPGVQMESWVCMQTVFSQGTQASSEPTSEPCSRLGAHHWLTLGLVPTPLRVLTLLSPQQSQLLLLGSRAFLIKRDWFWSFAGKNREDDILQRQRLRDRRGTWHV